MATKNRIFISFAIQDKWAGIRLAGQAKNEQSPFEFIDMSVKEPWDEKWKTQCRSRIKGCDGVVALLSSNTAKADGQLWEMKCANDEAIPMIGVYVDKNNKPSIPEALRGKKVIEWTWDGIATFIDSLP
jgi:hypothetical protein